jgi:biotin synthase-related radical SAM superfamily protein
MREIEELKGMRENRTLRRIGVITEILEVLGGRRFLIHLINQLVNI